MPHFPIRFFRYIYCGDRTRREFEDPPEQPASKHSENVKHDENNVLYRAEGDVMNT